METKKYICLDNYVNFDGLTCFKKNNIYFFKKVSENVFYTEKNELGYSHELDSDEIEGFFSLLSNDETLENIGQLETPKHYDNSKGSIYQFCENQNLNSYEFDIIKRVVRSRKKGNFKEDLEKTKHLIDLYLKEYEEIKN